MLSLGQFPLSHNEIDDANNANSLYAVAWYLNNCLLVSLVQSPLLRDVTLFMVSPAK